MVVNILAFSCALAFYTSGIYGQCLPLSSYNFGLNSDHHAPACNSCVLDSASAAGTLIAADGGGFAVTSVSPIPPYGVSVESKNEISGYLAAVGQLPFLGTTYLEGAVPSAGVGAVTYGCGYGDVGIVSEEFSGTGSGRGYTNGFIIGGGLGDRRGCGCGTFL